MADITERLCDLLGKPFSAEDRQLQTEAAATIYALRRRVGTLQTELNEARNVRRSDDQVGLVCATCSLPVETEPCPDHSPRSRA